MTSGDDGLVGGEPETPDETTVKRLEGILLEFLGMRPRKRYFFQGLTTMRAGLIAIERHMDAASLRDMMEMLRFLKDFAPSRNNDTLGFRCFIEKTYPEELTREFTALWLRIVDKLLEHKDESEGYQFIGYDQTTYAFLYDEVARKIYQRAHYDHTLEKPFLGPHNPPEYASRIMTATLQDTKQALEEELAKFPS